MDNSIQSTILLGYQKVDLPYLEFDPSRGACYEKTAAVLASRSDDQFTFLKPWGRQRVPAGGRVLVPLTDGMSTGNLYGCHPARFEETYKPAGSGQAYTYEKCVPIHAYQPGIPFAVRTVVDGSAEVDPDIDDDEDWVGHTPSKATEVLAFRSDDQFAFLKLWGRPRMPAGSWVLVPFEDGTLTGDLYGCDHEAFTKSYKPARSGEAHKYERCGVIQACQRGTRLAPRTIVNRFVETDPAIGGDQDWLVRNPGGEVWVIADAIFRSTYRRVNGERPSEN